MEGDEDEADSQQSDSLLAMQLQAAFVEEDEEEGLLSRLSDIEEGIADDPYAEFPEDW